MFGLLHSGNATIHHRFAAMRPYFINVYAVFLIAYGGQKAGAWRRGRLVVMSPGKNEE